MSEILDFFSRVVPWGPDLVNLHWKVKDKPFMPGLPFKAPEDLISYAAYAVSRPKLYGDLYYCLSSQVKTGKTVGDKTWAYRDHSNVGAMQSIWLDLDINDKGYPSVSAAIAALQIACTKVQLPIPSAIVSSGGGLHVYWFNDQPLTLDEWRLYSEGLRRAGEAQGLKADWSCTTDSVRVLRIPGTVNHKFNPPRLVKILAFNPTPYAFKSTLNHIMVPQGLIPVRSRSGKTALNDVCDISKFTGRAIIPADDRGMGMEFNDAPLAWEPLVEASGCPHVLDALQTGGTHYAQPLWHLDALLTAFLVDGRKIFHRMSNRHPGYDAGAADAMYDRKVNDKDDRGLGWPSCAALEGAGCKSCAGCPHRGKIRSPLNLTRPRATPLLSQTRAEVNVGTSVQVPTSTTPFDPNPMMLPRHYQLNKKGQLCEGVETIVQGGQTHTVWEPIASNKMLGDVSISTDPTTINFKAVTQKNEEREIMIPFAVTGNKEALLKCLAEQDINVLYGKGESMFKYGKAYVEVLQASLDAHKNAPYGWVTAEGGKPAGFNYGGMLYKCDGTEQPMATRKDDQFRDIYKVFGDEEAWYKAAALVTEQGRPALEAIVAASFASPLLYLTGEHGGTVAAVGLGGGNKSTAVDIANAVWGKPISAKAVLGASKRGVMKKLTDLHNLPMYWDDVKGDKLPEAAAMVSQATEGQDPLKLTSDRRYAPTGTWQCMLIIVANASIIDELLKSSKTDSAQLHRVFQFNVPKVPDKWPGHVPATIAAPLLQQLDYNYGCVGARYARWLGSTVGEIENAVHDIQDKFNAEVNRTQEERFWAAICATIYAGAHLANKGLGTNFHLPELWAFLKEAYFGMRERVSNENLDGGSEANTERYLTGFFKEEGNHTLTTWDMVKEQGRTVFLRVIDQPDFVRFPTTHINVHWVVDDKVVRLSKQAFRTYIEEQKTQPSFVLKGLKEHFGMYEQPKVRLHAGLRAVNGGGREPVLVIPIKPDTWLWEELMSRVAQTHPLKGEGHQVSPAVSPIINAE